MRSSVFLVLLCAGCTLRASSSSSSPSYLSQFPSPPALPLSFSPYFPSTPLPPYSSPSSIPNPSRSSFSRNGTSYSPLSSSQTSSSNGSVVLTQSPLSSIPVSSYTFAPFPSPSSEPPVPGVYPLASPKAPPPVDSPTLVPDFAIAWTGAYKKARAKVSVLISLTVLSRHILSHNHSKSAPHQTRVSLSSRT